MSSGFEIQREFEQMTLACMAKVVKMKLNKH